MPYIVNFWEKGANPRVGGFFRFDTKAEVDALIPAWKPDFKLEIEEV
jgi:hypothetical protein